MSVTAPLQPLNHELVAGMAVSVTTVPEVNVGSAGLVLTVPLLAGTLDGQRIARENPSLGGYGGPQSDPVRREQQVTLIQTAIKGHKPDSGNLHLADFTIAQDAEGVSLAITCPEGQTVPVTPGTKPQRFAAQFTTAICESCPLSTAGRCLPQPDHRRRSLRLTFDQADIEKSQRHRRSRTTSETDRNLRPAVEAIVRSIEIQLLNSFFQGSQL